MLVACTFRFCLLCAKLQDMEMGSAAGFGGSSSAGSGCAVATGLYDAPASGRPQRLRASRLPVLQPGRRSELKMAAAQVPQSHALRSLGAPRWRCVLPVPHPPTGGLMRQRRPHRLVTVTAAPRAPFVLPPFQCWPLLAAEISCNRRRHALMPPPVHPSLPERMPARRRPKTILWLLTALAEGSAAITDVAAASQPRCEWPFLSFRQVLAKRRSFEFDWHRER